MIENKKETEDKSEKNDEGGEEQEEGKGKENSGIGDLFSPEGIIILFIAAFFDIIGGIPVVGWISDVIAWIVMGLWFFLSGKYTTIMKKKAKSAILTFIVTAVLGLIPIVEDIAPIISLLGITFNQPITVSWIGWTFWVLKNS
ncbi:MAG: hypothetical protein Q8Q48_01860 [Candidatus Staskawiczbacteria bacterium]|nr:hypothetical protein [Candidatus Staskawiczbacteria bacterium]